MTNGLRQAMQRRRKQQAAGTWWRRPGARHTVGRWGSLLCVAAISACGAVAQTATGTDPIPARVSTAAAKPLFGAYIGVPVAWTPAQTLRQEGVHAEFGIRVIRGCFVGFDASRIEGTAKVTLNQMPASLGNPLRAEIAELEAFGLLPPGYQFELSGNVESLLLSVGPQFTTEAHHRMIFFANPDLGAMRVNLTPKPEDAFTRAFVAVAAPSGHKVDWTPFYGGAAGIDIQVGHNIGLRSMVDVLHSHAFNDLIANGAWSYRLSTGISFQFGRPRVSR
jgi:hypothetical protein